MARNRPAAVRAAQKALLPTVIDGLSARALADIAAVEARHNALSIGGAAAALRRWREFDKHQHRMDFADEDSCTTWYCCGSPAEMRQRLEQVLRGLPTRSARELRALVGELDERW
jgi:hypothetical protein